MCVSDKGWTAYHAAMYFNKAECAIALLEAGADPHHRNNVSAFPVRADILVGR